MTAKEAYRLLMKKYPGINVVECYEYASVFSFLVTPAGLRHRGKTFDTSLCVVKNTAVVRTFKPFDLPVEEYRAGKRLSESMYGGR